MRMLLILCITLLTALSCTAGTMLNRNAYGVKGLVQSTGWTPAAATTNGITASAWWAVASLSGYTNGQLVTAWTDSSGSGHTLTNTTGTAPYWTNSYFKSSATVKFSGGQYLDGGDILDINGLGLTVFVVFGNAAGANQTLFAKALYGSQNYRYFVWMQNTSSDLYTQNDPLIGPYSATMLTNQAAATLGTWNISGTNSTFRMVTRLYGQTNTVATAITIPNWLGTTDKFLLGAYNNGSGGTPPTAGLYLNGHIAEMVVYERSLMTNDMQQVEQYLMGKYGL